MGTDPIKKNAEMGLAGIVIGAIVMVTLVLIAQSAAGSGMSLQQRQAAPIFLVLCVLGAACGLAASAIGVGMRSQRTKPALIGLLINALALIGACGGLGGMLSRG